MIEKQTDVDAAKSVLRDFFQAMNKWEKQLYLDVRAGLDIQEEDKVYQKAKENLEAIFAAYCAPGKADRRRVHSLSCRSPATYDIHRDTLSFLQFEKGMLVFLYEQHTAIEQQMKFYMKKYKETWRIHKSEFFDDERQKWGGNIL